MIENNEIITDENELTEILNEHYVNIVENSSGKKPHNVVEDYLKEHKKTINCPLDKIKIIKKEFQSHPSIVAVKSHVKTFEMFSFREVTPEEVKIILKKINTKKSTGEDKIPPKLINCAADIIFGPLSKVINQSLNKYFFPNRAKRGLIAPIDKGGVLRIKLVTLDQ